MKQIWCRTCQQLADHDEVVASKEAEIANLKVQLHRVQMQSATEGVSTEPAEYQQCRDGAVEHLSQLAAVIRDDEPFLPETRPSAGRQRTHEVEHAPVYRGYHVYKVTWDPYLGDDFSTTHQLNNSYDKCTIAVLPVAAKVR